MEFTKHLIKQLAEHEANICVEQAQLLLKYQAIDKVNTHHFYSDMERIVEKSVIQVKELAMEWIKEEQTNTLPNASSGSFLTALTDIDGLMNIFERAIEEFEDEDEDFYNEVFTLIKNILIKKI